MTGQEKGDLLIQVTAWADLTVYLLHLYPFYQFTYFVTKYRWINREK